jgi:hypothetical protein
VKRLWRKILDIALNAAFISWVAYFLATGSVVPEFILPDQPSQTAEVRPPEQPEPPAVVHEES